jgi:hypothetical protein
MVKPLDVHYMVVLPLFLSMGFSTPAVAQRQHSFMNGHSCPGGVLVIVDRSSGLYHFFGEGHYGPKVRETFMCQRVADSMGFHLRGTGRVWDGVP